MRKALSIHEIFKSIQGEGRATGRPTTFIRVVGCNLDCHYCDTGYRPQDDRSKIPNEMFTHAELLSRVRYLDAPYICFTGGEPLLHDDFLYHFIELHKAANPDTWYQYSFETNGTIPIRRDSKWRDDHNVVMTMDIKPFAYATNVKTIIENLDNLTENDEVKIVICNKDELALADTIISSYPSLQYILSPVHDGKEFVTGQMICDYVTKSKHNVRVGIQIHKLLGQR
jgi:7-carboxy-7-deazaguanine synthase